MWCGIHIRARLNSLLKSYAGGLRTGCYLKRPSGLTGPSSDLGSGLRELQAVWAQPCMTGHAVGPVLQMSTADQTLPTRESTQASSRAPTSPAFLLAWSTWAALMGIFRTGFKPWKLCSMYAFFGGPLWYFMASSGKAEINPKVSALKNKPLNLQDLMVQQTKRQQLVVCYSSLPQHGGHPASWGWLAVLSSSACAHHYKLYSWDANPATLC